MSNPQAVRQHGATWRLVRVLRKGQQPAQGNVTFTLHELAKMTGKQPAAQGNIRVEYERLK